MRWAVLAWLSACLLLAPMGGLRHALTHLGDASASSQDDEHPQDKLGHCDLCQLWDLPDATLPAAFHWQADDTFHPPPAAPLPASATVGAGAWFQSRAPPLKG